MAMMQSPMQRAMAVAAGGGGGSVASSGFGGGGGGGGGGKGEGVNVVPMIDVVLCLIVFFLLVGHLAAERRVAMNLPMSEDASRLPIATGEAIVVNIEKLDGTGGIDAVASGVVDRAEADVRSGAWRMTMGGRVFDDAATLAAAVLDEPQPGSGAQRRVVEIRADRGLPFAAVGGVLAELERVGVSQVRLSVRSSGEGVLRDVAPVSTRGGGGR